MQTASLSFGWKSVLQSCGRRTLDQVLPEALAAVQQKHYDLIFMDMQMPNLDGYGAAQRIRALGSDYTELTIIAMTANAMEGDREKCLASGMDDYLSKPLKRDKLERILNAWLAPGEVAVSSQ